MNETASPRDALRSIHESALRSIRELVEALAMAEQDGDDRAREDAVQAIAEDVLSVEVRSDWYAPGSAPGAPAEYCLLITTGGPAVRIVGRLNQWCEPEQAWLEIQDWFTPWTTFRVTDEDTAALLAYARCFWFGEG